MFSRKKYTRIPKREVRNGLVDVSREELEDFQRQFGKHLTLRDLLNYDRTGKLPGDKAKAAPASEPAAKPKSASQSAGERLAAYDRAVSTMPEGTSTAAREALMKSRDAARDAYEQAAEAERAGRPVVKTGAKSAAERVGETTLASRAEAAERRAMEAVDRQRAERAEQMRQADLMRPGRDAITPTLGPEMGLAAAGRTGLALLANTLASAAGRLTAAEGAKRVAEEASRRDPDLGLPPQGSVWRSNRPPKDEIPTLREVVEPKPRIQVEGTKGGVYRSPKDEAATKPQPEFRSRTADRMDEKEMLKKGGTTKAYAKGGSVKGSGCEQRGLRKCKVY